MFTRLLTVTTFLTSPALAADFPLRADVSAATIYLQGAALTRVADIEVPAGAHRLLVPIGRDGQVPQIALEGAALGAVEMLPDAVVDGRVFLAERQQAAYDDWQAALEAGAVAEDARLRAAAGVKAAEDRLAFLRSVSGAELATLDPAVLAATAAAIGSATAEAEVARADARAALRTTERAVQDAALVTRQAKRDLDATGANLDAVSLMAIGVNVPSDGTVTLTLDSFSRNAGWQPTYDVTLGADDRVNVDRKVSVYQNTGLALHDVALTLSTADPFAQTAPSPVFPNQARIENPEARLRAQADSFSREVAGSLAAPAPEMAIMAEDQVLVANFDGPVVSYDYPTPVSLPIGSGQITLALDSFDLDARVFNRAVPRRDQTAFLMAEVTNTSGEPLLAGQATIYREDVRIGEAQLPFLAAGDDTELAFGPQHHLPIEFALLDNETGDRGLIWTSGTRQQDMVFRIRNLSDMPEEVEARFALPFSEQEDLEVSVRTSPNPDATDIDDLREVSDWVLTIPAGDQAQVDIAVTMEWPEDQVLTWRP